MTAPCRVRTILACIVALLSISASVMAQHPLDSWARRTVPGPSSALYSIAFGNGTFVAVGDNSFVARSTDGINWTSSTAGAYGALLRVRFLNGQFMAVGSSDKLIYSSDGANWAAITLPQSVSWDIAWGNGVYVLGGPGAYVSADGVSWTRTHPRTADGMGIVEAPLDTVVFANGGFMALPPAAPEPFGSSQPRQSQFSTNGTDWVARGYTSVSARSAGSELIFQDNVWLSIMDNPRGINAGGYGNGIWASTNNGVTWALRLENLMLNARTALSYGDGYYVALMMENFSPRMVTSTNGFLSSEERTPQIQGFFATQGSAFGNGTFVAVGWDGSSQSYVLQSGNVSGAPIILQEPQDRSAVVDNPATFTVQVVGGLPLWYQWYRDGTAISGATNASYTIAHVSTSDVGGYHAIVTNSINSVTSRVAQLTVAFLKIKEYAGIEILGVPGRTYQIDASPASGPPNWQTLTNLPLPATPYIWVDYASPSFPARIYRAAELP